MPNPNRQMKKSDFPTIDKYLHRAFLRKVEGGAARTQGPCSWICIPVCDELEELPATLASLAAALPTYGPNVLLTVNHSPEALPERKQANLTLLEMLRSGWTGGLPTEKLAWIDAASAGKELMRGVGEARKVAMDNALNLIYQAVMEQIAADDNSIRSTCFNHFLLVCLDADSHVAPDYWQTIEKAMQDFPQAGGFSLGFHHRPGKTEEDEHAIRRYEAYMNEYVAGLKAAGSPYAYHSVGSSMAATAACYAAAGGMRMPKAGEDFYFLEAIAKVRPVVQLNTPIVFPSPRQSNRVFFGTGPMMISLLHGGTLEFFKKENFDALKALLDSASDENLVSAEGFLARQAPMTRKFLDDYKFAEAWQKINANLPHRDGARLRAFHLWFDALKTYRFIRL